MGQLIEGETYYTNFGYLGIQKLKLDKILIQTMHDNIVKVSVSGFPKKANEKHFNSWQLWSDEIFMTREQTKKSKFK